MILYADASESINFVRGRFVLENFKSTDKEVVPASRSFSLTVAMHFSLVCRLLRLYPSNVIRLSTKKFLVVFRKRFYHLDFANTSFTYRSDIVGSSPINVLLDDGVLFYGEYRQNKERSPIALWRSTDFGETWESAYQFDAIRHIHGVFKDPYEETFYVTTGDSDRESAIWVSRDGAKSFSKLLHGSQQTRAVQLGITKDAIYFGSDSPLEQNYLYRLERESNQLLQLGPVAGSVFYAKVVGEDVYFSTAVEPSDVNKSPNAQLWKVSKTEMSFLYESKKDIWSKKYFL
ncbi:hypothetical protein A3715_18355, partial [Oleiphilus sp. HI0009]